MLASRSRLCGVGRTACLNVLLWVYLGMAVLASLAAHQRGPEVFESFE